MKQEFRKEWLTLPNFITLWRIGGTIWSWFYGWYPAVFVAIAISDLLDGWVARNWKMTSKVGELLDPLADKILVLPLVWYFWVIGSFSAGNPYLSETVGIPLLITAREIVVLMYKGAAKGMGERIHSLFWGKVKVTFEYIALFGFIYDEQFYIPSFACLIVSIFFSYISLIQYKRHYDFLTKQVAARQPC